jgi:hypothetical protein
MTGWADNYSRVAVTNSDFRTNELGIVQIKQATENFAIGTLLSP